MNVQTVAFALIGRFRSSGSSPPVAEPVPQPVRNCVTRSKVATACVPGHENGECHCQMPPMTLVTNEELHTVCHSPLAVTPVSDWKVRESHGTNCVTFLMASLCCHCWKPTNLCFCDA